MTSTNISVGLTNDKLTSRVLKPPGGGHTNIFGPPEPEVPKRNRRFESSIMLGGDNTPKKADVAEAPQSENGNGEVKEDNHIENGEQIEREQPKEVRPEPVNPEPVKPEPVKPAEEPPRRVRVPPGGFSSGLW